MKITKLFVLISTVAAMAACQSKFEEAKPDGRKVDADSKAEYIARSQDILKRFNEAQDLIRGMDQFLLKLKASGSQSGSVSSIVIAILDSVKNLHPEKKDENYETDGQLYLTTPGLSEECRVINTKSIYNQKKEYVKHDIQISTCKTKWTYKSILSIAINSKSKISVISEKDMMKVLPDVNLNELLSLQGCSLERGSDSRIRRIDCEASDWIINAREQVHFYQLSYDADSEVRYLAQGYLMEDGQPKVNASFEVDNKGKFTSSIDVIPSHQ